MNTTPLKLFVRPERRFVAEGRPTELLVLIRATPEASALGSSGVPLNLAVVLDACVDAGAVHAQRTALLELSRRLRPGDRIAVVSAGTVARVILRSTAFDGTDRIERAAMTLSPDSASAIYPAWLAAGIEVAQNWNPAALNRIIVLSTGPTHLGAASREQILKAARGLHRRGIGTSSIGIGHAFDEDLLVPIASEAGGNAWFAENLDDVAPRMADEAEAARGTWCEWASMRFDTEGADVVEVLNDLPWLATNKLGLGTMVGGAPIHVVARLRLSPSSAGEDMAPLTVRLKALDLTGSEAIVFRKSLRVHVVAPQLADGMEPDLSVQAHAARLQLARSYRRCLEKLDAGDSAAVRSLLDFAVAQFRGLAGQQGGTMLTRELHTAVRLREASMDPSRAPLCRKLLRYSQFWVARSDLSLDHTS